MKATVPMDDSGLGDGFGGPDGPFPPTKSPSGGPAVPSRPPSSQGYSRYGTFPLKKDYRKVRFKPGIL